MKNIILKSLLYRNEDKLAKAYSSIVRADAFSDDMDVYADLKDSLEDMQDDFKTLVKRYKNGSITDEQFQRELMKIKKKAEIDSKVTNEIDNVRVRKEAKSGFKKIIEGFNDILNNGISLKKLFVVLGVLSVFYALYRARYGAEKKVAEVKKEVENDSSKVREFAKVLFGIKDDMSTNQYNTLRSAVENLAERVGNLETSDTSSEMQEDLAKILEPLLNKKIKDEEFLKKLGEIILSNKNSPLLKSMLDLIEREAGQPIAEILKELKEARKESSDLQKQIYNLQKQLGTLTNQPQQAKEDVQEPESSKPAEPIQEPKKGNAAQEDKTSLDVSVTDNPKPANNNSSKSKKNEEKKTQEPKVSKPKVSVGTFKQFKKNFTNNSKVKNIVNNFVELVNLKNKSQLTHEDHIKMVKCIIPLITGDNSISIKDIDFILENSNNPTIFNINTESRNSSYFYMFLHEQIDDKYVEDGDKKINIKSIPLNKIFSGVLSKNLEGLNNKSLKNKVKFDYNASLDKFIDYIKNSINSSFTKLGLPSGNNVSSSEVKEAFIQLLNLANIKVTGYSGSTSTNESTQSQETSNKNSAELSGEGIMNMPSNTKEAIHPQVRKGKSGKNQ